MARYLRPVALAYLCLLLSACVLPPRVENDRIPPKREPTVDEVNRDHEAKAVSQLIEFYRQTSELKAEVIRQKMEELRPELVPGRCNAPRLRLAMLASRVPAGDKERSIDEMLGPCLDDPFARYTTEGGLALMLKDLLTQQAEVRTHAGEIKQLKAARSGLRDENAELKKQLEGLKAIERSIQERDRETKTEE